MFFYTKRMLVVASLCLLGLLLVGPASAGAGDDSRQYRGQAASEWVKEKCTVPDLPCPGSKSGKCGDYNPCAGGNKACAIDTRNAVQDHWRYRERDRVLLVFENLNPFRYEYDFHTSSQEISEDGLNLFVGLFPTFGAIPSESDDAESTTPSGSTVVPSLVVPEREDDSFESDPAALKKRLFETLESARREGLEIHKRGQEGLEDLNKPRRTCQYLVDSVVNTLIDTDPKELEAFLGLAEDYLGKFRNALRDSSVGSADPLWKDLDRAEGILSELQKKLEEIEAARQRIANTLKNQDFFEVLSLGGEMRTYQVHVSRRMAGADKFPKDPYIDLDLDFGSSRFALAVGAAFADLEQPEFGIKNGFVRDREGEFILDDMENERIGRVVTQEDGSDQRATPSLLLHTRLWDCPDNWLSGVHFSLGLSGNFEDSVALEYLAGISLGFAKNQFFLTLGYYNGRVESLRDGFFEGAELPESIEDVPILSDREEGFAVAFSYKIK